VTDADDGLGKTDLRRRGSDGCESALDLGKYDVKESDGLRSLHSIDLANRYVKLNLEIVLRLRSMRDACDYHLVFRRVPLGWPTERPNGGRLEVMRIGIPGGERQGDDEIMFAGVTELVQGPKGAITSLVWLKRHHRIKNFRRNVPGIARAATQHFGFRVSEGELGLLAPPRPGAGAPCLVESRSEMADDFERDPPGRVRRYV
jgi:hypothetical protein